MIVLNKVNLHRVHPQHVNKESNLPSISTYETCACSTAAQSCVLCSLLMVSAKLGANAILGVSLAVCKAGAAHKVRVHTANYKLMNKCI